MSSPVSVSTRSYSPSVPSVELSSLPQEFIRYVVSGGSSWPSISLAATSESLSSGKSGYINFKDKKRRDGSSYHLCGICPNVSWHSWSKRSCRICLCCRWRPTEQNPWFKKEKELRYYWSSAIPILGCSIIMRNVSKLEMRELTNILIFYWSRSCIFSSLMRIRSSSTTIYTHFPRTPFLRCHNDTYYHYLLVVSRRRKYAARTFRKSYARSCCV